MTIEVVGIGKTPQGWVEMVRFPVTTYTPFLGLSERVCRACHELGAQGAEVQIQDRHGHDIRLLDLTKTPSTPEASQQ